MTSQLPLTPTPDVVETPKATQYAKMAADELEIQNSLSSWRVRREVVIGVVSLLITFTSAGLILGFGPLYSLLIAEGQWSELCDPNEPQDGPTCARQEVHLQYVFSAPFQCLSIANAAFGLLVDIVGPRACVTFGLLISFLGHLLIAYGTSTVGMGYSIIAGASMLAIGGYGLYLCSFQFVQLFKRQGFLSAAISGLFNASGYVFMLLHIHGVTRKSFFTFYAVLTLVACVGCFVLFPLRSLTQPSAHYTLSGFSLRMPGIVKPHNVWPVLKPQLKRPDLWFFALYFGWISTFLAFSGGAIPDVIFQNAGSDTAAALNYIDYVHPLVSNSSFLFTPFMGMFIDRFGFRLSFAVTSVLILLFLGFLNINSLQAQIVTFLWYSLAQGFFYSLQFAYVIVCFPVEVYGSMQCFIALFSLSMGFLNYIFTPWAQNTLKGDYTWVLVMFAIPVVLSFFCLGLIQETIPASARVPKSDDDEHLEKKLSVA
ncbi:hypothetical protein PybrP1_012274 [[Pythium] brassicae (nom. inval.)]|nr:hypothetical protein PybrP1_012274 [[Pythium] brassicae (nom. inval.)]